MMQIKVFVVLVSLVLNSYALEFEWSDDSLELSKSGQQRALNKYMDLKYPEEAKIQKKLERENSVTINGLMWQDNDASRMTRRDLNGAKKYCSELKLLGFNDWFLPTKEQLESTVDKNRKPAIKKEFRNIVSSGYWSSSPNVSYSDYAWYVYFKDGNSYNYRKTFNRYVRCARAGQ